MYCRGNAATFPGRESPDMSGKSPSKDDIFDQTKKDVNLVLGVSAAPGRELVTARKAGGIADMRLPVSPLVVPLRLALQNMAKAINLAFQADFLETELEKVYKAARVYKGRIEIQHKDYIGLGDGMFAKVGKMGRSIQLTFRGPDPVSPEGQELLKTKAGGTISGLLNLILRKFDLTPEFEDMVPTYVEQMLDRLEAAHMIVGWSRCEWEISTTLIGLDVLITPVKEIVEEGKQIQAEKSKRKSEANRQLAQQESTPTPDEPGRTES